ncbi:hypothetical protein AYI69_g108 [Smittium culicis]|uniref:Bromodomain associated domain-containing protein n=1 Tax=Smittium culicis TaxID=133412 RepID=A0A1R1YU28_9FUNG|nr:hypothetical protein AYI69_g108 [Smittium culicis]
MNNSLRQYKPPNNSRALIPSSTPRFTSSWPLEAMQAVIASIILESTSFSTIQRQPLLILSELASRYINQLISTLKLSSEQNGSLFLQPANLFVLSELRLLNFSSLSAWSKKNFSNFSLDKKISQEADSKNETPALLSIFSQCSLDYPSNQLLDICDSEHYYSSDQDSDQDDSFYPQNKDWWFNKLKNSIFNSNDPSPLPKLLQYDINQANQIPYNQSVLKNSQLEIEPQHENENHNSTPLSPIILNQQVNDIQTSHNPVTRILSISNKPTSNDSLQISDDDGEQVITLDDIKALSATPTNTQFPSNKPTGIPVTHHHISEITDQNILPIKTSVDSISAELPKSSSADIPINNIESIYEPMSLDSPIKDKENKDVVDLFLFPSSNFDELGIPLSDLNFDDYPNPIPFDPIHPLELSDPMLSKPEHLHQIDTALPAKRRNSDTQNELITSKPKPTTKINEKDLHDIRNDLIMQLSKLENSESSRKMPSSLAGTLDHNTLLSLVNISLDDLPLPPSTLYVYSNRLSCSILDKISDSWIESTFNRSQYMSLLQSNDVPIDQPTNKDSDSKNVETIAPLSDLSQKLIRSPYAGGVSQDGVLPLYERLTTSIDTFISPVNNPNPPRSASITKSLSGIIPFK